MTTQLLLDLFNREFEFNNFIASGNEICVANLQNFSNQYSHIYGLHLTGKTHLLKSWVNLSNHKYGKAIFLSASDSLVNLHDLNLDMYRFIAIDNIDLLTAEQQIELFDLFNHIKLHNRDNFLLTSSTHNLSTITLRNDLKTRLQSGLVFALKSLNDDELLSALNIFANREGIKINEPELKYLVYHYTRNLGQLINLIHKVAIQALSYKKLITIPLIKSCILAESRSQK
jgi:DnaA family protein